MPEWPKPVVRVDYTTPELEIPTNYTILPSPRKTNIHQGRSRLPGHTETGRATVRMSNLDRSLDPTLHPEVKPGVHLNIQTTIGTQTWDLFTGFVRSFGQEWPGKKDAVTPITAEDAFSLLARYELEDQAIGSLATGAHLQAVLELFGWPAVGAIPPGVTWWRLGNAVDGKLGTTTFLGAQGTSFDTGSSTLMATTLTGNLLSHLLNAAETTERGTLYVGPDGGLVFNEKPTPFDPSMGTWGDEGAELRYTDLKMDYDDDERYNDIRLTRRGDSVPSTASNVPAGTAPRTLPITDTLFSTIGQQDSMANELLAKYQDPTYHPVQMVMRPPYDSPLWAAILGVELGSRLTVRRRPPGGGAMVEVDCLILGMTYDISPSGWEITWDLAPAEQELDAWYLGHVGHSELGTHTILG